MKRQRCEGCRWFLQYPSQDIGQCRRYPPTENTETGWLEVNAGHWCGEWADAKDSSEQDQRRELINQFAVALVASGSQDMIHKIWQQAALFADYEGQT